MDIRRLPLKQLLCLCNGMVGRDIQGRMMWFWGQFERVVHRNIESELRIVNGTQMTQMKQIYADSMIENTMNEQ